MTTAGDPLPALPFPSCRRGAPAPTRALPVAPSRWRQVQNAAAAVVLLGGAGWTGFEFGVAHERDRLRGSLDDLMTVVQEQDQQIKELRREMRVGTREIAIKGAVR